MTQKYKTFFKQQEYIQKIFFEECFKGFSNSTQHQAIVAHCIVANKLHPNLEVMF